MRKVTFLKQIEDDIQTKTKYQTEIIESKPKYFGTFPYPYMNGKLHLGHAFTMLKVDFECRWKQLNGYNVLFPFGFHCTGTPIYSSAKKLEKEIETNSTQSTDSKQSQWDILAKSGIPVELIPNFVDPYYWVQYFPELGQTHIKKIGAMVDLSRSFVTTNTNPFYDSFVRWQFNKLYAKGYLKFGTRNSIYSNALDIQCQDHDRSLGEGVQTEFFNVIEIMINNDGSTTQVVWIPYSDSYDNQNKYVKTIKTTKSTKFNLYQIDGRQVYMTQYVYSNYCEQFSTPNTLLEQNVQLDFANDNIQVIKKYSYNYYEHLGGEVVLVENMSDSNFILSSIKLELSTDLVVDRVDQVCVVKPVPQWYIDYANPTWKQLVIQCIDQMKLTDQIKTRSDKYYILAKGMGCVEIFWPGY